MPRNTCLCGSSAFKTYGSYFATKTCGTPKRYWIWHISFGPHNRVGAKLTLAPFEPTPKRCSRIWQLRISFLNRIWLNSTRMRFYTTCCCCCPSSLMGCPSSTSKLWPVTRLRESTRSSRRTGNSCCQSYWLSIMRQTSPPNS